MFDNFISPLALDEAKVGFAKALLERINELQLFHYNRGDHIPFKFSSKKEKERLLSIVWERTNYPTNNRYPHPRQS